MKKIVTALCALSLTVAVSGAAFADCPGHASVKQPATTSQGT
ncbi:hypothetical protein [Ancylobacter oerskovii]|uniref:DUF680 domain-containing protein n=1 Tax=Ancylobacter oerskovii TaxID=459519 RepID=A0ABW4YSP5_9HYPH|nr:hypothetical protein [Ancylobacter oerskovii]